MNIRNPLSIRTGRKYISPEELTTLENYLNSFLCNKDSVSVQKKLSNFGGNLHRWIEIEINPNFNWESYFELSAFAQGYVAAKYP